MDRLLSGRRVLVVEDEMLVLIMIEDMLADLGCKSVTSGATVEKAALINAQVFDVAILDMNLVTIAMQWRTRSPRAEYRLSTRPATPVTVRETATPTGPC
jgi:CheY-like chemotaxis protein